MSICTGAFALAHAGLLDGRHATTHWDSAEQFRRVFPGVHLEPNVLYVDEGSILTSAGVAAGLDLCLHVIRRDHGADLASHIARHTVVGPYRDGDQAQFIEHPVRPSLPGAMRLGPTLDWQSSTSRRRSLSMTWPVTRPYHHERLRGDFARRSEPRRSSGSSPSAY